MPYVTLEVADDPIDDEIASHPTFEEIFKDHALEVGVAVAKVIAKCPHIPKGTLGSVIIVRITRCTPDTPIVCGKLFSVPEGMHPLDMQDLSLALSKELQALVLSWNLDFWSKMRRRCPNKPIQFEPMNWYHGGFAGV